MQPFASRIIDWQQRHGRHTLPWQGTRDPYRIWLSEIMLQQTQVASVIPYYQRFVARFPTLAALAQAGEDDVLALWSGLGYYSRARNLHAAARIVTQDHQGRFPGSSADIARLPGIGRSTAAAIAALSYGERCAILDGNVKRVLARHGAIAGWPGDKQVEARLWQRAEALLPDTGIESYTQGMMDLGALVCTRSQPGCHACPVSSDCGALAQGLTAVLPAPRPRKTIPERQVQMLILLDRGELLLEKRPSRGIWGGMWSLPELESGVDPATHCRDRYGFTLQSQQQLPGLTHAFTHFRLHIQPVKAILVPQDSRTPDHVWLSIDEAADAALPAPIRKLINQLSCP